VYRRDLRASPHDCPLVRAAGCGCTAEHEGLLCLRDLPKVVRNAGGESNVFLMHQSFISLALLIATTLVAGFFAYIHSIKRQTYLLLWTAAWAVFALHYVGPALDSSTAASPLQSALDHWLFALSGVLFFLEHSLLPAEALENSRAGCGPTLRTVDRSQRHRRDFRFRGHSRFFAVHRGGVVFWQEAGGRKRSPTGSWAFPSLPGECCGSRSIS